jgi:hypothetical protein
MDKFGQKRIVVLVAVLALAIVGYIVWDYYASRPRIEISRTRIIKSNYDFIPEHWKEPRLALLREKENFKDLPSKDQLDLFLKLCDWTHRQWKHSNPDPYPLSNAIDILADIRAGRTGGFCGQYGYVLGDVLKSMGYFAVRYVELTGPKGQGHFVVEVWSEQFNKWMVLDADQDLYFEIKDTQVPANAYEIRDSMLKKDGKVLARSADDSRKALGAYKMELYANFAVSLRSDLLRHPKPLTVKDRFDMFLFFRDSRTRAQSFPDGKIPYSQVTDRIEDVYFDCNCVRAEYQVNQKQKTIDFHFFTDASVFNFKGFMASLDSGKKWEPIPEKYSWPANAKNLVILVAPVNMAGRLGSITTIRINPY